MVGGLLLVLSRGRALWCFDGVLMQCTRAPAIEQVSGVIARDAICGELAGDGMPAEEEEREPGNEEWLTWARMKPPGALESDVRAAGSFNATDTQIGGESTTRRLTQADTGPAAAHLSSTCSY